MKKSKLITSLCLLVLTFACLTFGVYSAVKTSFTASGTITFNAYGLELDVKCTITGTENNNKTIYGTTFTNGTARENYTSTTGLLADVVDLSATGATFTLDELKFDELNESAENKIEVTFEFYNYSSYQVQIDGTITDAPDGVYRNNITELSYIDRVSNTTPAYGIIVFEFTPKGTAITADKELAINFNANPMTEEFTVDASGNIEKFKGVKYKYAAKCTNDLPGMEFDVYANAGDVHIPYSIAGQKVYECLLGCMGQLEGIDNGGYYSRNGVTSLEMSGAVIGISNGGQASFNNLVSAKMSLTTGWFGSSTGSPMNNGKVLENIEIGSGEYTLLDSLKITMLGSGYSRGYGAYSCNNNL